MRRRGMLLLFVAVSALVAGGLGWLTQGSLREEEARRLSAQKAERAEKERLALWKLDGRFYLPLGLEGYRQFEDYTALYTPPGEPVGGLQYLSPLVAVELPEWMRLHVQLDPKSGWQSPQVLSERLIARLSDPELDLDLSNISGKRTGYFRQLVSRFPVAMTLAQLKCLDGDLPDPAVLVVRNATDLGNFEADNMKMNTVPYQGVNGANPSVQNGQLTEDQSSRIKSMEKSVNEMKGVGRQGNAQLVEPQQAPPGSGQAPSPPSRGGRGAPMNQDNNFAQKRNDNTNLIANKNRLMTPVSVHLGAMRPVWLTDQSGQENLFIMRPAKLESATVYQGIALDWTMLQAEMLADVKDEFPDAQFRPLRSPESQQHQLTALPVVFEPGPLPALPPAEWTPLRTGLVLAWLAAAIALSAAWLAGSSLINLSERRMGFVSAVTHELRTPLTSLRLYLDMLTSGMITEESKRQEYLTTLTHESDRLNQLIENVLDFAKLEKRAATITTQPVIIDELLEQFCETWTGRLAADGKEFLIVSTMPEAFTMNSDPRIVQQVLGNLIDNARKYSTGAADPRIWLWVKPAGSKIAFEVEDRGPGIPTSERRSIFKPFNRGQTSGATGGAGLGLALAKQWAETLGGTISYRPAEGATGAIFRLELPTQ